MNAESQNLIFKVKPRLLMLLGDQLIRDANLAVFELVKNAYDADATNSSVTLEHPDNNALGRIVIQDDGIGMDENILRNVWMVIATDHRTKQRQENTRTPLYNRYPLGEKGLGRLSIHKLGRFIQLTTRMKDGIELALEIDWDILESAETLDSAGISLVRRETPRVFLGADHGTKLEVTKLRETWTRGELRKLHRAVNSLCSPYKGPADFNITLSAPGKEEWLDRMFTSEEAFGCALYKVTGWFEGSHGYFEYNFTPPPGTEKQLTPTIAEPKNLTLTKRDGRKNLPLDLTSHSIGKVEFEFWLFDRDPAVIKTVTDDITGLKDYLDENGGIRVYRDGIRVYDFGESGNDWLNLDLRRVNTPTAKTSNNQILGVLRLDAETSKDLREKSNREGFIESQAYADFKEAVTSVLTQVEAEKSKDQKRVREATGKGTGQKLFQKLSELREILEKKGVLVEVEPRLKAVEKEIETYRDQLLHAAVPGLTLGIMLHGAEQILDELRISAKNNGNFERTRELVDKLYRAMRPVTNMLKNPGVAKTTAFLLIKEAIFSTELRLKRHGIKLINGIDGNNNDFEVQGSKQMLIASITNLIDNSIHWLEMKNPQEKLIYIGTSNDVEGGPAIIVGDNGPGFGNDLPEDLITPFFTRRNGGMGLGLYIVSEVMRINKGSLIFPDKGDIDMPEEIDGAVTALQFVEKV